MVLIATLGCCCCEWERRPVILREVLDRFSSFFYILGCGMVASLERIPATSVLIPCRNRHQWTRIATERHVRGICHTL
jgi:hypothetical protein